MSSLIFSLEDEAYQQDIDPVNQYIEQAGFFLSKETGDSLDVCKDFVKKLIRNKSTGINNPTTVYLRRQDNGDRIKEQTGLYNYIYGRLSEGRILAPTLTTYLHPTQKPSLLVKYTQTNITARGVEKRAFFKAKEEGDEELAAIKDTEQTNRKLDNNALSGAQVSASTPLSNKTAHSTLTSVTRTVASFGNANNEKFVSGNRHYWCPMVTMDNVVSITSSSDLNAIDSIVKNYNLIYPTADDVMDCILYSSHLYWASGVEEDKIREFVSHLTDTERAAFVYTGDFYHLRKHNTEMMRVMIQKLSSRVDILVEDPLGRIKTIPEEILNLTQQICNDIATQYGKNYKKMLEDDVLKTILGTALNVQNTLLEYRELIQALLVTKNIPASIGYLPQSIRRTATTSDTDSTIFTVQEWINWYCGDYIINDEAIAVASVVVFLASQAIRHILAILSANFNYARDQLHRLSMKNEYRFDVFIPTQVSKHYFALIGCREGNVHKKHEVEIKGVHLKNSNTPPEAMKVATDMMKDIMNSILNNKKISIREYLSKVASIELNIKNSLLRGETTYYRNAKIKDPSSYKNEQTKSPYIHHMFWQQVFEEKYGPVENPPYYCIKIPTTLTNTTSMQEWFDVIRDESIKRRLVHFFKTNEKKTIPTLYLTKTYVQGRGIPEEIIPVIAVNRIVLDLCNVFYLVLETLGYYKNPNRLVSDDYSVI